ncbi:MAG: glucose-1-phosphate adenylyltransferase [Candidatus Gygaella obscura]|nr:glucose-1-phosphate adenylyltransferase [Candidatus Gygaella obscura]
MKENIVTFLLAGGRGKRLSPLTKDRTKPAVPFGGAYRIVDFTLSNCVNSGLRKINVLIQYKSHSLQRHLRMGWNIFDMQLSEYIDVVPAQQRMGDAWYKGTADAIYQNLYTLDDERGVSEVLILAGDHIYKMDYNDLLTRHRKSKADLTVAAVRFPKKESVQLGVIEVDRNNNVVGFKEKKKDAGNIPEDPENIFASMGIYVFNPAVLKEELKEDSAKDTEHDFGKNIINQMLKKKRKVVLFDFKDKNTNKPNYWLDIGTLEAYYDANMDLVEVNPVFNLYDRSWPVRTHHEPFPPAKTVFSGDNQKDRIGLVMDSLVTSGCIISGGKVQRSILSYNVRINSFSQVLDSILMEGVNVGRHAKIKNAIIDKDVNIPENTVIGYDTEEDKKKFFVTERGIVVVAKGTKL